MPQQGTEEQAITTSAKVIDPDYSTIINNGDAANATITWTVTKDGQPFYPYTSAQGYEHYTSIFYGSGNSTFSFVPDDAGTYQVTATVEKYIFNLNNNDNVQFIGPVTSVGTVVVAGLPPTLTSISTPRFAQVGKPVNLTASASDPSPVESPLTYSWDISRNGQPFQTGSGTSYSFTPSAPGVYAETLTVSDPAGRSVSQTGSTLVSGGVITVTSAASTDMPANGLVTLSEALEYTAAIPGSYQIDFAPSLSGQSITLPAGLTITGDVTIDGTGASGLILNGSAGAVAGITAITVGSTATVTLRDLTVSSGSGLFGGAIDNYGILTLADSTIENSSAQYGGGIFNSSEATLTVLDSTIADNTATYQGGGGIDNNGTLTLIDSTIADNRAANAGGGLYNVAGGTVTVQGTIIAANSATTSSPDVYGTFVSLGNNLIGNPAGATGFVASDLTNVPDPGLAPLANNGGPTPTIALLPGSPAINTGFVPAVGTPSLSGLIHQWSGEGNANDSAGSSNGTLTGAGVSYASGIIGQAFQFNGTGGYVTLPTSADVTGTGPLSISVWIKTSSDGVIIQQRDPNNSNGEYQLAVQGGKVYWWDNANGQYGFQITSTRSVADGQWHHIVAVREANGTGQIFIDGQFDSSQAGPDIALGSGIGVYLGEDVRDLYFEAYGYSPEIFTGLIDQVGLYSQALSPVQVQTLYNDATIPQTTDQRGFSRSYNGTPDIGAFDSQPYVVTSTADSGPGSLRQAVIDDVGGVEPIIFDPSLTGQTITLGSGPIEINHNVTIIGLGANDLTISGTNNTEIFKIDPGATASISGVTLANGFLNQYSSGLGGAVNNAGTLNLNAVDLSNNAVKGLMTAVPPGGFISVPVTLPPGGNALGGAIYNTGTLNVTGSTFNGNWVTGGEGAEFGGFAHGGAIYNAQGGVLIATNDTFASNYAVGGQGDSGYNGVNASFGGQAYGGAIDNAGIAWITNTTIADGNVSPGSGTNGQAGQATDGAGIYNEAGASLALVNSIVAANTGGHDIINLGTITGSNNLATSTSLVASSVAALTTNPALGTLQINGGTTPTLALLPGSPAIDAGTSNSSTALTLPGLVHEWNGEGNPNDSAGSSNGTLTGTGVSYAAGILGQAFQFNGSGGYVTLPTSADITGTGPLSISVWIKTSSDGVIVQQRDSGNCNGEYQLAVQGGKVYWWDNANGQYGFQITSNASVANGQWHHIVAVREANGTGQIFIDGQLDSSQAGPDVALGSGIGVYIGEDVRDLYYEAYGYSPEIFTGLIDQVGLYSQALSPTEVQLLYSAKGVPTITQGTLPATDHRGLPRIAGSAVDIGAVESQPDIVTSTADSGPGSLRQAIANATQGTPITFAPSLAGQTITLKTELLIARNITIDASAAPGVILSGGGTNRVFEISQGANVFLDHLTVENGRASKGGGILNEGVLTLNGVTVADNGATSNGNGGGIENLGVLTLTDATVASNVAAGNGGGIDSTGTLNVFSSTIADNQASNGGGLYVESGTTSLHDAIIAGDSVTTTGATAAPDLFGAVVSLGNNLIEIVNSEAIGLIASDLLNVNPDLGPLEFNGGPTPTLALLPGSPAINAGNASTTAPATVPSPVHDWNGNGNANDSAGSSNGTLTNTGVSYASGVVGQAFQFNGSGGYVTLPTSADVTGTGPLSISVWIKTSSDGVIIQQRDSGNCNGEYQLAVQGGKVYWWDNANGQYGFQITSNASVANGQWHHIVAVREANGTGQIFIDGQFDSSQAGPDIALGSGIGVYIGEDVRDLYYEAYGYSPEIFTGLIEQVGIYNQALSPSAVQTLYSNHGNVPATQPAISGLVGQWQGNGNTNDSGGFDNATTSGTVGYAPGVVGQAFQFNGSGTVVASDTPALDSTTFTVGGWFNISQAPAPGTEYFLASKYDGNYHGWILRIGSNLQPGVSVSGSSTADVNVSSPTPIGLNTWYYLAATYDGSTVRLYIDGTLAGSTSLSHGYVPSATSLTIGSASWYSGGNLNGMANEFSVFNRALSPVEIQALYANLGQATYAPLVLPTLDQNGNTRVANGTVDIGAYEFQNVAPLASSGSTSGYTITAGQSLTLNASASVDPEAMTLSYAWDINGDGIYTDATGVSPTLTWAQLQALDIGVGTYQVTVQVTAGGRTAISKPITLTVLAPPTK